jgi:hypothetical protein
MNLEQLRTKLEELRISPERYYVNGRFGSLDDNDKHAMIIKQGKYFPEYEVYFKERGIKHSSKTFSSEAEACELMYSKLKDEQIYERIQAISGLDGMTVNERLFASELLDELDWSILNNKARASQILRWLRVDESSIKLMLESTK